MSLFTWAEGLIKNMKWYDIGLFKIVVALPAIIIGAYISEFVKTNLWYFVIAFVILDAFLFYRLTKKK